MAKVIVRIKGGLGNQVFCYAAARRYGGMKLSEIGEATGDMRAVAVNMAMRPPARRSLGEEGSNRLTAQSAKYTRNVNYIDVTLNPPCPIINLEKIV